MAAGNIAFRLATIADAAAIATMSRELIETGLGWSWTPDRVGRAVRNRETTTLIAADAESMVGFAIMRFGDEHAHINLLAVRPSHQRTGIGRRMIDWLMDSARTAGIASVSLELRVTNHAGRDFYRSLGFGDANSIPGYYRGRETALRMVRHLRPADLQPARWTFPTQF